MDRNTLKSAGTPTQLDSARAADSQQADQSVPADAEKRRRWTTRQLLAGILLIGYIAWLCAMGIALRVPDVSAAALLTWEFQDALRFIDRLHELPRDWLFEVARYFPIGFLVPLTLFRTRSSVSAVTRFAVTLVVGLGLAVFVRGVVAARTPDVAMLIFPAAGAVLGIWFGLAALRGPKGLLMFAPQVGLAAVLVFGMRAGILYLFVEDTALEITAVRLSPTQRRDLLTRIRTGRTEQFESDGSEPLILSEEEAQELLAWGLALDSAERKAEVQIRDGTLFLRASLSALDANGTRQHVNFSAEGDFSVTDGEPSVRLDSLTIGRVPIPPSAANVMASMLESALRDDPDVRMIFSSVASLRIHDNTVELIFSRPEMVFAVHAHVGHLISIIDALPNGDAGFQMLLSSAFDFARSRSQARDPAKENQAAILAISVLLGYERVEELVGPYPDRPALIRAQKRAKYATLRGRGDWVDHFVVSAVVTLWSTEAVSDRIGLFKESLDAEEGGSGYSFADLLADRAGTMLAEVATRSEFYARLTQERLAGEFAIDDLFPEAADLPEGISEADLQSEYGGVDGPEYRQLLREIERRLAGCAALH